MSKRIDKDSVFTSPLDTSGTIPTKSIGTESTKRDRIHTETKTNIRFGGNYLMIDEENFLLIDDTWRLRIE